MKLDSLKQFPKKVQLVDVLLGVFIGIILTLVFVRFALPNLDLSKKSDNSDATGQKITTTISDSPYLGNKEKAKVAIIEFSDFECPYCQQFFESTFGQIVSKYVDTDQVVFVYRNLPLPFHQPAAETEANAALCVKSLTDNAGYFKMAELIYKNTGLNGKGITDENLIKYAIQTGASESRFKECLSKDQFQDAIAKDSDAASKAGISGTPSFVIGKLSEDGGVTGELVIGAMPLSDFETTINKYLK